MERDHTKQWPQHQQRRITIVSTTKCYDGYWACNELCGARARAGTNNGGRERTKWSQSQRRSHGLMIFTSRTVKRNRFQSVGAATNRPIVIVVAVLVVVTNKTELNKIMAEQAETRKNQTQKTTRQRYSKMGKRVVCASADNVMQKKHKRWWWQRRRQTFPFYTINTLFTIPLRLV